MTDLARTVDAGMTHLGVETAPSSWAARSLGATRSRGWLATYRLKVVSTDVVGAAAAAIALYAARFGASELGNAAWLLVVPPVWVLALTAVGAYRRQVLGAGSEEYRAIGRALVLLGGVAAFVTYVWQLQLPRSVVLPLAPTVLVASLIGHAVVRAGLHSRRAAGRDMLDTVVVGPRENVAEMIREIASAPQTGMRVVAACVTSAPGSAEQSTVIAGVPVFGTPETALRAVDELDARIVAVASHPDMAGKVLRRLGWALAERRVDLFVAPGIVEVAGPRLALRPAAGLSLLHVERPSSGARVVVKRTLDSLIAFALVLLVLPFFAVVAVLIRATSRGPVFFRQERVGIHGESFHMFKFRTMVVDAEQRLETMARDGQVNAVLFKDRRDPRVTSVGRVLRRFSVDELPQLFNVLLGDMSLVGPRPPLRREVDLYEPDAVQRLRVRPGMTGLWQISGRSDLDWEQSLRLDLWYVDNWSPVLDLQILVRTFKAVVGGVGAY